MWDTTTYWFDVAIVMTIFAVGNILMGHFEEHRSKFRRVLKVGLVLGLALVFSSLGLRWVTYSLLGVMTIAALYIHVWWLPSHGIHGWTGEPKEKYYELLGVDHPKKH